MKELELFAISPASPLHIVTAKNETIETIYFGGGTPSLLSQDELKTILERVNNLFPVVPGAEVTLEANPDDISHQSLLQWKRSGINRLSIGVQSFFEEDLQWMNRAHNASQAVNSLQSAVMEFANISIDLIYGTPGLSNDRWKYNVETAIGLGVPHLSCYALTVEPKTPLDKMIREHTSMPVDPDTQSEQFLLLMQWLATAGYEHYEISNFAKPGFRSRHNSSYWQGKWYFGFGPSAHSFDGKTRWWNVANNNKYIQSIQQGIIPFEKEELTQDQQTNEYIMISLRTAEGIDMEKVSKDLVLKAGEYQKRGWVEISNNRIRLTNEGKLLADGIAADFFT